MDLRLSEEQQFFRDTTRRFLETECPLTEVRRLADDPRGYDAAYWCKGAELGWTSMLVAEEHGGGSLSEDGLLDLVLVAEEMGRLVSPGPLLAVSAVAGTISRSGTPDQRAALLPGLLSGEAVATWAYAEPGRSCSPAAVGLEAVPAVGGFVLNGTKSPVEAAAQASHLLVTARLGDALTQFLVPTDTAGVTVTPLACIDFVRKYGEVHFDNVHIPASAAVGGLGAASVDVERQLQVTVILQCAEVMGATQRVLDFTVEYAFDRYAFGRPLAAYQALKHRFADMKLWLEAGHAATTGAARAAPSGAHTAAEAASVAKAYVAQHAPMIIEDCVQMHGGIGVTWDHDIHLYLRRVTLHRELFGSPSEHRERVATMIGL